MGVSSKMSFPAHRLCCMHHKTCQYAYTQLNQTVCYFGKRFRQDGVVFLTVSCKNIQMQQVVGWYVPMAGGMIILALPTVRQSLGQPSRLGRLLHFN